MRDEIILTGGSLAELQAHLKVGEIGALDGTKKLYIKKADGSLTGGVTDAELNSHLEQKVTLLKKESSAHSLNPSFTIALSRNKMYLLNGATHISSTDCAIGMYLLYTKNNTVKISNIVNNVEVEIIDNNNDTINLNVLVNELRTLAYSLIEVI